MSKLTPLAAQAAITEVHQLSTERVQALIDWENKLNELRDFVLRIETNPCETMPETKKCDKSTYRLGHTGLHIVQAKDATAIGFRDQNGEVHAITMPREATSEPVYSSWSIEKSQDDDLIPTPSYYGIAEKQECSDSLGTNNQKTLTKVMSRICKAIELADSVSRPVAPIMELDPESFTLKCLRQAGLLQSEAPLLSVSNPQESFNSAPRQPENVLSLDQTRVLVTA